MTVLLFILALALTVYGVLRACNYNKIVLYLLSGWIAVQSALALSGFYKVTDSFPPRFAVMVLPPVLLVLWLSFTSRGKQLSAGINISVLVWVQSVRILIEVVLYLLYTQGSVPQSMTFEGTNFDILAGLSAPVVAYLVFTSRTAGKQMLKLWNVISLVLLLNVVITGALSVPGVLQKLNFQMPNTAMLQFPFNFLPGLIVPVALLTHLKVMRE